MKEGEKEIFFFYLGERKIEISDYAWLNWKWGVRLDVNGVRTNYANCKISKEGTI